MYIFSVSNKNKSNINKKNSIMESEKTKPLLELSEITAISSVDGRYGSKTAKLRGYLSEHALFKYRTKVELEYFKVLCGMLLQLEGFPKDRFEVLDSVIENFSVDDSRKIKSFEKITNHDVKAVEYFLREIFDQNGLSEYKEFIHFGLTSYDINSPAVNMMIRDAIHDVILYELKEFVLMISNYATAWDNIPMLAHTHGQPASPTKLGKEIEVFVERLRKLCKKIDAYKFEAKFGGATGNFNAHFAAYPKIDWHMWADEFLRNSFGLVRQQTTTQIESYDNLAELFDLLKRINTVFIDLSRDMWTYISMGYFSQKVKQDEVGSSAMPHKVNPIDFENAEGNAGVAIALFEHLATKLPISRLQRDLSGSTVERVIGLPIGHFLISILSLQKAFTKVDPDIKKINNDLENNWVVVAEAIQTILRRENYPDPYSALKKLTRGKQLGGLDFMTFIDSLDVSIAVKDEIKFFTPWTYTGKMT
jgi:adenylosuccinate lyase